MSGVRRIGIMGGTFDPIHYGHLVAGSEVAHRCALDRVVYVPTGQSWQKEGCDVSPAEHRYVMAVIATAQDPEFVVSRVDIDRPGPTYTIDTLRDMRQCYPDAEFFFITGVDALAAIMTWRDWHVLLERAHFVGVTRPGYELGTEMEKFVDEGLVSLVEIPALAISSTECRARVRTGQPIRYLVPEGVARYIEKCGLYAPGTEK